MVRCLSFLSFLFLVSQLVAQPAAQWRGENRDGKYPDTGLLQEWPEGGPELLWHYDELGDGHASAAIANGIVYTSGTDTENGFVIAFDNTGKVLWKSNYGKEWFDGYDGVRSTPMINNGKVYIMSGYGVVSCMDAQTGARLWQVDLMAKFSAQNIKWGLTENLLAYDEKLIVTPGGSEYNVIALNKNTGELIWKCAGKGEKSAYCSPQLVNHNGRIIVVTQTASSILGIDANEGKLLWSHPQPNKYSVHANTPLYHKGKLYCVSGYGKGGVMLEIAKDGNSIKELWRDEKHDNRMAGVVLMNGRIYGAGDFSREWFCLDWETGQELFTFKDFKQGVVIAAEGLLYCYSQRGDLYLVEPGESAVNIKGYFEVPFGDKQHWSHIVIDSKKLFVRHGGSLMVYDIEKK
jgi:outer membrane protein assembly factor BamB